MNSLKCPSCGLVNFTGTLECRRCATWLAGVTPDAGAPAGPPENPNLTLRVVPVVVTLALLLFTWWASLLLSSAGLDTTQRTTVGRAIDLLRDQGFSREVLLLERLTSFRSSDNWWNTYVGHPFAYASTNFPFEVMTLYAPFFEKTEDDVERAIILLHEAQHLQGFGEQRALEMVWRSKARLGWTAAEYGGTRLWKNTREWTADEAPLLFGCGTDYQSDCSE